VKGGRGKLGRDGWINKYSFEFRGGEERGISLGTLNALALL
jgi:hypothetical protein